MLSQYGKDDNLLSIITYLGYLIRSELRGGEFVSFFECHYVREKAEISQASAFVINPFRRHYNEVSSKKTVVEIAKDVNLRYKPIQKLQLILPNLKQEGSELKYLYNGALVIKKSLKEKLENSKAANLKFLPVLHRIGDNVEEVMILDHCISVRVPAEMPDADWYWKQYEQGQGLSRCIQSSNL